MLLQKVLSKKIDFRLPQNGCALYTVLWLMYSAQSALGLSAISKIILILLILFSTYKAIRIQFTYKLPQFIKSMNCLLTMMILYGLYYIFFGPEYKITEWYVRDYISKPDYLKNILISLLPIYVYYDYAQKGVFTNKSIFRYTILIIAVLSIKFVAFKLQAPGAETTQYVADKQNNIGYEFVPVMAMLLLINRWKLTLATICYLFIIISLKRGAIIIGSILMLIILWNAIHNERSWKKIGVVVAVTSLIGGIIYFIVDFYNNTPFFQKRLLATLNGDSSGRNDIFGKLWNYVWDQESLFNLLFGNGADATVAIAGNYAHNDWLEILINQGLVGVLIFAALYLSWVKDYKRMYKLGNNKYVRCFGAVLFISFAMSLFSMSYTKFRIVSSICIGISYYQYRKSRYSTYLNRSQILQKAIYNDSQA